MSRTTPSVTRPATLRCLILAQRMSPKMPASVTPIASATTTQPGGISSIAALVERGEDHEAGVARSSRAGMKRKVNARPTMRGCPERIGRVPRIQIRRNPCLSRTVVIVAVDTGFRASMMSLSSLILPPGARVQTSRAAAEYARIRLKLRPVYVRPNANRSRWTYAMCNAYRLVTDAATLFEGFSQTRIRIRFSEGVPNIEAREDIKITDTAPIVRAVDGERDTCDLV